MRRLQALLITAGLAVAPSVAIAGPDHPNQGKPTVDSTFEKVEWSTGKGRLGVMVMSLTPELRTHFGAQGDRGVLVAKVEPKSPAAAAGIQVGDVLVDVRGHTIDDAADVTSALGLAKKGDTVAIQVLRDKKPVTLQVKLQDDASAMNEPLPSLDWLRDWFRPLREPVASR